MEVFNLSIWIKLYSFIPEKISRLVEEQLFFGGEINNTKAKVGYVLIAPIIFSLAITLNLLVFTKLLQKPTLTNNVYIYFLFFAFLGYAGLFLLIKSASIARARKLEETLPDALELISTNMKSGLTTENALVNSARPEFGELSILLKRAAKQMFAGKSLEKALQGVASTIDSEVFNRTIWLLTEGMKKGGSLGTLLLRISDDLRSESAMKKEINANISVYITLILISSSLGAPLLFGAGTVVAEMMTSQSKNSVMAAPLAKNAPSFLSAFTGNQAGQEKISSDVIQMLSLISLVITSFFAGILIGIIKYNKESEGMKYFIPMLAVSIIIYFFSSSVLRKLVLGV
jgi:pilus assembly protein TadC